jgi:hypothetical protein
MCGFFPPNQLAIQTFGPDFWMAVDSHTEFEAATLGNALLKEFHTFSADEFCESSFKHEQAKENARAVRSSFPPDFISSLIQPSSP